MTIDFKSFFLGMVFFQKNIQRTSDYKYQLNIFRIELESGCQFSILVNPGISHEDGNLICYYNNPEDYVFEVYPLNKVKTVFDFIQGKMGIVLEDSQNLTRLKFNEVCFLIEHFGNINYYETKKLKGNGTND